MTVTKPIHDMSDAEIRAICHVDGVDAEVLRERIVRQYRLIEEQKAELAEARGSVDRLVDRRDELTRELAELRSKVRRTLIEAHLIGNLTDDQLDAILDELGLPSVTREFQVEATIYARQKVKVTVEGRDPEEAREHLLDNGWMAWEATTHSGWEAHRGVASEDLVVGAAKPVPGMIS